MHMLMDPVRVVITIMERQVIAIVMIMHMLMFMEVILVVLMTRMIIVMITN